MSEEYTGHEVIQEIMDNMFKYGLTDDFIHAISDLALDEDEAYELMIRWDIEPSNDGKLNLEEKMQKVLEKHNLLC